MVNLAVVALTVPVAAMVEGLAHLLWYHVLHLVVRVDIILDLDVCLLVAFEIMLSAWLLLILHTYHLDWLLVHGDIQVGVLARLLRRPP